MDDDLTVTAGPLPGPSAEAVRLSDAAATYARQALSPAALRAYRSHLRAWEAWCRGQGVPPAPVTPALVANHLADLAGRYAP